MFLIQIHQLLQVCIFASFLSLLSLFLSLSVSLSIHTHTSFQLFLFTLNCFLFSAESFKNFLQASWLFIHKNFSTSKNKGFLLQNHSAMITSGKLTQIQHYYVISSPHLNFSSYFKNGLSSWTSALEMRGHSCRGFLSVGFLQFSTHSSK